MRSTIALLLLAGMAFAPQSRAQVASPGSSYTGNFAADDDQKLIYFSLPQSGAVTLRTWSYAGGVNAAGSKIPQGGFDPTLSVFDDQGRLIAANRDGGCGNVAADSVTSFCWDSFLPLQLPAGNYLAVLTQSENLANGPALAQSFVYDPRRCTGPLLCPTDAQGNFTTPPSATPPGFWDVRATKRTPAYAVDILGAASTTTTITTTALPVRGVVGSLYPPFTFTAQSGQQATLTWSVSSGSLPPGLTLNPSTGTLSGTPTTAGTYPFAVQVTDGFQSSAPLQETLVVYNPLRISSANLPTGTVGQPYSGSVQATGGSGNYSWTASGLPAGLGSTPSGAVQGTPTVAFSAPVFFTVFDSVASLTVSSPVPLTILAAPIVISGNTNLGDVPAGAAVAASYSASGGVPPYKFSLSGAPGLTVDATGNVRGSASQAGSFSPTLTVSDSANGSSSLTLSFAVLGITGSFPAGTTTSPYSGSAAGVGGVAPYTFTASGVPPGATFSAGSLSGQIKTPGTYSIGVRVTDANGVSASANFSFAITGPAVTALTIVTHSLPDGFVGQSYAQGLGAAGGAPGYTWSQSGGQSPAGLSLSTGGTVSGVPQTPGTFSLGVQVSDTSGATTVGAVAINIQPAPLQITSGATLPAGLAGVDYQPQILSATGGTPPYSFSIKGSLPDGLTLSNGQIAGRPAPTAAGNFGFNLVATDSGTQPLSATLGVTLTINPKATDLALSSATVSFSLAAGATATPQPNTIFVSSSDVSQVLAFTSASSVPWLTVGGSSGTPGGIAIGLNNAALALNAAGSPYSGTVTVTCTSDACAGKSQSIAVSLTITAPPPQLSLGSPLLSFVALTSNPQTSVASLSIVNAGGGSLAIQSVTAADRWISVGGFPATVAPGPGGSVNVTVNPAGLQPGYYLSSVTVASSAGSASVPVTLLVAASGVMTLGPAGTQFSTPQGGALGNPGGSFLVSVSSGIITFNANIQPGATWLSGGGIGTASPASPGTVNFSLDPTAVAALPVGVYYGTIRVSSSGAVNSPQDFQIVLNITPPATTVVPDPSPAGLIFITSANATPPAQNIQLFASSKSSIQFQAAASVESGTNWLSVTPTIGSTSAASPAQVSVKASPGTLPAGVYRGSVSFEFSASAVRTVNVTLIVQGSLSPALVASATPKTTAPACAGAQLVPTQTGLTSNFQAPASWPTPLAIRLVDTCGSAIGSAQVVTTFSNGDPPLALSLVNPNTGLYSGTWTPRKTSSQITIQARASAPGYTPATTQINGQVAPNTAPVLAPNGTLDVFHPQLGAGLGPGNIVQIYGSGLVGTTATPVQLPLPTKVNGTSVLIGGVLAPLFYVSPVQINAQIPFELTGGTQYQVVVNANGALTTPQPIQLTSAVPAILQFDSGAVVAQHQDGTLIQDSSPAVPGEFVTIYLTGLGATDNPVPTGAPSPSGPLARVLDTPTLTLNNTDLPVLFAGLTPGLVGLYQINFQVPAPLTNGNYELFISQSGALSNQTVLAVNNK